jgi:hypothetical protein
MEQYLLFNQDFLRIMKKVDPEQQGAFHCWQVLFMMGNSRLHTWM